MYIVGIEAGRNKRYKVLGEDGLLFSLYGKELKQYHIEAGKELSDKTVEMILTDVVYKRGRERALYLLERSPLTISMLRKKLSANDYPKKVIDWVVDFLLRYHYLDDKEYVRMYLAAYSGKKSRKQISYDLLKKGITREDMETCFADCTYSEDDCFKKQFERYIQGKNLKDWKIRQKVFRYFYGKGFASSLIEDALRQETTFQ